jgi:hypothetical protein
MKNYLLKFKLFLLFTFIVCNTFGQTAKQREVIKSQYNLENIQQLASRLSRKAFVEKQNAIQLAKIYNWPITKQENGSYMELQKVVNGKPIYYTTFNVDAAKSTRTNHLSNGGSLGLNLEGQNMTAYIWDGGLARSTHQEYDGAGGNNRFSIGDGSTTLHYHSAHVTGTIIASGVQANAKGMAPQASAIGFDWNSDVAEATTASGNGMLISNHSYGFVANNIPDQWFGAYRDPARDWDDVMFNTPNYLMVCAAGNDGTNNFANGTPLNGNRSYDKLSGFATAKNNLVVANAQDANIDSNGNLVSVTIENSSSEGPTDDLRIKPDITGNGVDVTSTYESSDSDYGTITGTSMASPNVAGTLLLLQQHANNVNGSFMKAATLKGLALHTADDAGITGPDAIFGWGLLNAKVAAETISKNGTQTKIEELTLSDGQSYQITVDSDGVNDLKASISWTDRAGTANNDTTNSSTAVLVNDLDIRVTKSSTTYKPWRLTNVDANEQNDNTVDPFERVDVTSASGSYTITVTHKGSLTGGSQNYTLIITGLTDTPIACNATTPTGLAVSNIGTTTADASWNAVSGTTYDVRYRQTGTSTWTTNAVSATSTSFSGLTPNTEYEVQVRSKCSDGTNSNYSSSVTFTTDQSSSGSCTATTPTNLNASVNGTNVDLTWDAVSGATYEVDYRKFSVFTWTTLSASTNSATLTGLNPNTYYFARVRSMCSDGSYSSYTPNKFFKTNAATSSTNYATTSQNLNNESIGFNLYPNPVNNYLNISISEIKVTNFEIINTLGQTIMKGSNNKQTINVSKLNSGVYIMKLTTVEGKSAIKRFIKQ